MMTTINGQRVPIVPRQLSTGEWIAERSPTCFGIGQTAEESMEDLLVLCGGGKYRPNPFREREVLPTDFGVFRFDRCPILDSP
jgi:hypothetical protein